MEARASRWAGWQKWHILSNVPPTTKMAMSAFFPKVLELAESAYGAAGGGVGND